MSNENKVKYGCMFLFSYLFGSVIYILSSFCYLMTFINKNAFVCTFSLFKLDNYVLNIVYVLYSVFDTGICDGSWADIKLDTIDNKDMKRGSWHRIMLMLLFVNNLNKNIKFSSLDYLFN